MLRPARHLAVLAGSQRTRLWQRCRPGCLSLVVARELSCPAMQQHPPPAAVRAPCSTFPCSSEESNQGLGQGQQQEGKAPDFSPSCRGPTPLPN